MQMPLNMFCGVVHEPSLCAELGAGGKKVSPVGGGVAVTVACGEQQVTVDGPGQRPELVVPVQVAVRLHKAAEFSAVHCEERTPPEEGQHRMADGPGHRPDIVVDEQL